MDINDLYQLYLKNPSVVTDTRNIKEGDIFFALKGPNHNGNLYTQSAFEAGASFCIVDEYQGKEDPRIKLVADTLTSLQQLAARHRVMLSIPVIAITGSNGKTTTKELVHEVLSGKYKTYTTEGNLNNHIGIPLTILKIKSDAEIAVIEMGANHQGEIKDYCLYAMPTHGLITNCGKAHIEGFGSAEGVMRAKGELFDYLKKVNGTAFVFSEYDYLLKMSSGIKKVITYGTSHADQNGRLKTNTFTEIVMEDGMEIGTKLVGGYNFPNVLAAVCIGRTFQVPDKDIKHALENYTPGNSRSQLLQKGSNKIILDAYNANPSSMKVAIENFASMPGKKIVMLGAMKELGKISEDEHQALIKMIAAYPWKIILVGDEFKDIPKEMLHFPNSKSAADWALSQHFSDTSFLIKGSRSMQMEKLVDAIKE